MNLASHIHVSASLLPSSFAPFPYVRHPRLYLLFWFPKALFFSPMVFENVDPHGLTYYRGKGDHLASDSNQLCAAMPSGRAVTRRGMRKAGHRGNVRWEMLPTGILGGGDGEFAVA